MSVEILEPSPKSAIGWCAMLLNMSLGSFLNMEWIIIFLRHAEICEVINMMVWHVCAPQQNDSSLPPGSDVQMCKLRFMLSVRAKAEVRPHRLGSILCCRRWVFSSVYHTLTMRHCMSDRFVSKTALRNYMYEFVALDWSKIDSVDCYSESHSYLQ
mgnify:CR=1 FL=1